MWTRARISVCAYFAILGLVCSAWVSSIDELQLLLRLDKSQLGWLLFSGPVGNLISFCFASWVVARFGVRRTVIAAASCYLLSVTSLMACFFRCAPIPFWCLSIACFGASGNIVNICMNTQAGIVERQVGRQIMGSFHGIFSVLMFAGAAFTLLTTAYRIPVTWRLATTLVLALALHILFFSGLPQEDSGASVPSKESSRWHRPDRSLVALGLAAFVIMGCEASICDWVCVFFRNALDVADVHAKWGLCAVTGTMAVARLCGDRFVNRFSAKHVLHAECLLVSVGLALALLSPYIAKPVFSALALATFGYAVAGFGIAGMIPILYSKVNKTRVMPAASALTFVGSMGFFGYFIGPPLIGHVAKATNLSFALGIFAVLILSCLFLNPNSETE